MAMLKIHNGQIVCISDGSISVVQNGSEKRKLYKIEASSPTKDAGKPGAGDEGSAQAGKKQGDDSGSDRILAARFSPSGRYFVACDDHKNLACWTTDQAEWTLVSVRQLIRRCMALTFDASEENVFVGDKSGDVYQYSLKQPQQAGTLLLGHISMLLDMTTLRQGKLLVTCDRDEKIRVSHYPNTHNIHTYCLGHTDFVNQLVAVDEDNLLISASGDGTIRLWDTETGSELACVNCKKQLIKAHLLQTLPDNKVITKDNNDSDLEPQGEGDDKDSEDKQNKSSEEDDSIAKNEDSEQNVQNSGNGENAENMETSSDSAVDKSNADILDGVFREVLSNKGQSESEGCLLEGAVPQVEISALRLCPKKKVLAVSFAKQNTLFFYNLKQRSAESKQPKLDLVGWHQLPCETWDMQYDNAGNLWVLGPDSTRPLVLLKAHIVDDDAKLSSNSCSGCEADSVLSCYWLLHTMLEVAGKAAAENSQDTTQNIVKLVQDLINGQTKAQDFVNQVGEALQCRPPAELADFLEGTVPAVVQILTENKLKLDKILAPQSSESTVSSFFILKVVELTAEDDADAYKAVKAVNSHWDFFAKSLSTEQILPTLHKIPRSSATGLQRYLDRKPEQIEKQKQRYKRQKQKCYQQQKQQGAKKGAGESLAPDVKKRKTNS